MEKSALAIGGETCATWKDDRSPECKVKLHFNPLEGTARRAVESGAILSESGTLIISVSDEAENTSEAKITLVTLDSVSPEITLELKEVNVIAGLEIVVGESAVTIGGKTAATWKDDYSQHCEVSLSFIPSEASEEKALKSGAVLSSPGVLIIRITDVQGNTSEAKITLVTIDSVSPDITLELKEVNVFAGPKIVVGESAVTIGDKTAATWKDDYSQHCEVSLSFIPSEESRKQSLESGSILSAPGILTICVSDAFDNASEAEITLYEQGVYGLESLSAMNLRVDEEVDLLQGLSFPEGVSLSRVEIESAEQRLEVPDPAHFRPRYPGKVSIILTVSSWLGEKEIRVDGLTVSALPYTEPAFGAADVIGGHYPWYNGLWEGSKAFLYHHILVSYVAGEYFTKENLEYILAGETPTDKEFDCENVGLENEYQHVGHADEGYRRIRTINPNAVIKGCGGNWTHLESYLNQHPDRTFMVSCAADGLGEITLEKLQNQDGYLALKRILQKENVIVSIAIGNYYDGLTISKTLNESIEDTHAYEAYNYNSASVNSSLNNKITVFGYNPNTDNVFGDNVESLLPVGYDGISGNMLFGFHGLITKKNNDACQTMSSMPTAALSGTLGNYLSIITSTNPGAVTLEDGMTIVQERYLTTQPFKYKDEDGQIKTGDDWYRIDGKKFLEEEVLQQSQVEKALASAPAGEEVTLPSAPGICYIGLGIQAMVGGRTLQVTEDNRPVLEAAIQSKEDILWTWSPELALKQGAQGPVDIRVFLLDTEGKRIPDLQLLFSK